MWDIRETETLDQPRECLETLWGKKKIYILKPRSKFEANKQTKMLMIFEE